MKTPWNDIAAALLLLAAPGSHWTPHHVTVPAADQIDISHLGAHTHENYIRFDTSDINVPKMQADPTAQRFRRLRVVAHCKLTTDQAALPPGFGSLQSDLGPTPTLGPIERWSLTASHHLRSNTVQIAVPTRFANWVAAQPSGARKRYRDPRLYSLEIRWEEWQPQAPAKASPPAGA